MLIIIKNKQQNININNCKSVIYNKITFKNQEDIKIIFNWKTVNKFYKTKIYHNLANV